MDKATPTSAVKNLTPTTTTSSSVRTLARRFSFNSQYHGFVRTRLHLTGNWDMIWFGLCILGWGSSFGFSDFDEFLGLDNALSGNFG
jgi:hypothetical protein